MAIILSLLLGAAIQWLLSHLYYEKAAKGLRDEATALRRKVDLVLRALEEAELVKLSRRDSEITGIVIHLKGSLAASSRMDAKLTVRS